MRNIIFIIGLLLVSCTKTWECDVTTITDTEGYQDTMYHTVDFKGTKEEMEEFESNGNTTVSTWGGEIRQTTECK